MELRSLDKIHLTEEQYLCFCKIAEHSKYVGRSFVKDSTFAYPKWQHLMENINSHPYFVWPTISGWLGPLKLGLQELKCPMAFQLYNNIQKAYEYCRSVYNAQQKCRLRRRHDNIRVVCLVYFISFGEGLFQVSLNPPAGKKSSDMNLSHAWHRWLGTVKELNMQPGRRDEVYRSKVRKLAVEAKQVNRVGKAWPTQLPTMNHMIQSIPCDDEDYGKNAVYISVASV